MISPMFQRHFRWLLPVILAAGGALFAVDKPGKTNPALVTAEQCAADDALQKLADAVLALQLSDGASVAELWRESPVAEASFRRKLLEERQLSHARRAADGAIEVDASLSGMRAVNLIAEITDRFVKGHEETKIELKDPRMTASATGRWRGPAPQPAGPAGWRHCDGRRLEWTAAATRIDTRQHLLAALGRWQVSGGQTIGRLWAVRPDFRQAVEKLAETLTLPEPTFEPAGLCRINARFRRTELVRLLEAAGASCATGIEADLSSAIDPEVGETLEVEGFAVAPPFAPQARRYDQTGGPKNAVDRPEWADRSLSVQVPGRAPEQIDAGERKRMAAAAATVEAKRQLWLQIEKLTLPSGASVGDVLARNKTSPAIAAINEAFAVETSAGTEGKSLVTITLSIPLEAVWRAVTIADSTKK